MPRIGTRSCIARSYARTTTSQPSTPMAPPITVASEQFGTNLRATATTTVPNFVRGAVVPLTSIFQALTPSLGLIGAGLLVGVVTIALAAASIAMLDETFGRDLDFVEH